MVNVTTPDFWTNTVECSPKTIDRQLGPLINQRVYCDVSLKPKSNKSVSTVFIGPVTCTGDTSIVEGVETFNTEAGSTSPIIKITLKKDELKIDNASLSCSLDIFSKVDNKVTAVPEVEIAKIQLLFFNLPLGELSDKVKDKIEGAVDDAEGIYKLIGGLNKVVNVAKRICQLIDIMYNVATLLFFVALIFGVNQATICATVFSFLVGACQTAVALKTEGCLKSEASSVAAEGVHKGANKFCDMVTCKIKPKWFGDFKKYLTDNPPLLLGPGKYADSIANKVIKQDYVRDVQIGRYMDEQHNLILAIIPPPCLPGIIFGLDKYRQIKCLYADCLQNAVGKEGLPVTACEDQKSYATCKYITGEIFAVFPWPAFIDHFTILLKNALSNPFSALGIPLAIYCGPACPIPDGGLKYQVCRGTRLLVLVGDAAENVKNIIDEGFKIRTDYCSRLKDIKKEIKGKGKEEVGEVKK